jgi:hypothetical protein
MKTPYSLLLIVVAAVCLAGCGKTEKPVEHSTNTSQPAVDLPALQKAVQSFNTQEGHFPKTLDELVPKYIAKVPDAPGAYKYVYDSATGNVKLSR